jgi:hypothetical protein
MNGCDARAVLERSAARCQRLRRGDHPMPSVPVTDVNSSQMFSVPIQCPNEYKMVRLKVRSTQSRLTMRKHSTFSGIDRDVPVSI